MLFTVYKNKKRFPMNSPTHIRDMKQPGTGRRCGNRYSIWLDTVFVYSCPFMFARGNAENMIMVYELLANGN